MKFEQDLVRDPHAEARLVSAGDSLLSRREVRLATDVLVVDGLRTNLLPPLVDGCCTTMLAVATALNRHEIEPEVPHLIEAVAALIEDSRTVFDAGLRVDDTERALIGAVMLEITVRGVCHALGIPYEAALVAKKSGLPLPVKANDGQANGSAGQPG